MAIIKTFKNLMYGFIVSIKNLFDFRDICVFGGLSMLGYGLYTIDPGISFCVVGSLLFLFGLGWLTRIAK